MNKTARVFVIYGSILMALSVVIGAFGAHILKNILSKDMIVIYHTGVEYQFYHSLGLFAVAFVSNFQDNKRVKYSGYFMIFGIIFFSGSLYLLSITGIRWIGIVTPIGGLCFIIAWILLALGASKQ